MKILEFLNLTSEGKLSISNLLLYIIAVKVIFYPCIYSVVLFLLSVLNYSYKRYISFKSDRNVTAIDLVKTLKEEFETYKLDNEAKIKDLENSDNKALERIRKFESF